MTKLQVAADPRVGQAIRRLLSLGDRPFREEVDADLRASQGRDRTPEYQIRYAALRSPEVVDRWFMTLQRASVSMAGQLASAHEQNEAAKAALRRRMKEAELAGKHDLVDDLQIEWEELKEAYSTERAAKLRFKGGLDEWIVEARMLRDQARASMYDSIVADERNYYAAEALRYRTAIEAHRAEVTEFEDEPLEADEKLWEVLP